MSKILKKYGRKFSFALVVLFFVLLTIALNYVLVWNGKIGEDVYMKLYMFAGGFITLLASSYFYANTQSKKFYNEDVYKLRETVVENKVETDEVEKQVDKNTNSIQGES